MKKCIFYLPYKLEEHGTGARMLRPRKMIQAFKEVGYDVYVISGYSKERKRLIKKVKKDIKNGTKYDFMYSESHTEPTLLTDPGHLPIHPFMDFGFFKYVKNAGINIGLFYCDIYWKFDTYGAGLPTWKRLGALACYKYDIRKYKKYLQRFYIPDIKVCDYIGEEVLSTIAEELPPGAEEIEVCRKEYMKRNFSKNPLRIFYVGGLGNQYQIVEVVKAIKRVENCQLTICCREREWEREKQNFAPYLSDRVTIIHKSSDELTEYYQKADVGSLLFKNDIYIEMAKPFKTYEYLANELPIISTKGTAVGKFVEKEDIGWNISYEEGTIVNTIRQILSNPCELDEKRRNCRRAKEQNLWKSRAIQVISGLK